MIAEAGGGVALGVEVDDQDPVAQLGQGRAQVDRRGGLAHAALLVGDGHEPGERRDARRGGRSGGGCGRWRPHGRRRRASTVDDHRAAAGWRGPGSAPVRSQSSGPDGTVPPWRGRRHGSVAVSWPSACDSAGSAVRRARVGQSLAVGDGAVSGGVGPARGRRASVRSGNRLLVGAVDGWDVVRHPGRRGVDARQLQDDGRSSSGGPSSRRGRAARRPRQARTSPFPRSRCSIMAARGQGSSIKLVFHVKHFPACWSPVAAAGRRPITFVNGTPSGAPDGHRRRMALRRGAHGQLRTEWSHRSAVGLEQGALGRDPGAAGVAVGAGRRLAQHLVRRPARLDRRPRLHAQQRPGRRPATGRAGPPAARSPPPAPRRPGTRPRTRPSPPADRTPGPRPGRTGPGTARRGPAPRPGRRPRGPGPPAPAPAPPRPGTPPAARRRRPASTGSPARPGPAAARAARRRSPGRGTPSPPASPDRHAPPPCRSPRAWSRWGRSGTGPEQAQPAGVLQHRHQPPPGPRPAVGAARRPRQLSPSSSISSGMITTRRRGSSPSDVVDTPSMVLAVSCTTLRSGGDMGSSTRATPDATTWPPPPG